jgi:hypothetical protein
MGCSLTLITAAIFFVASQPISSRAAESLALVSPHVPSNGNLFWNVPMDMPSVRRHSRFRVPAPNKLLVRNNNGSFGTLVRGSNPTATSLNLVRGNVATLSEGEVIARAERASAVGR